MPDVVCEGRRVVYNFQNSATLFLMKTFMSIFISIIFLIIANIPGAVFVKYPYETDNLLLMEMSVVGIAPFVLAFQHNSSLIKGKFLSNVVGRSVPAGLTLVVMTMTIYIYNTVIIAPVVVNGIPDASLMTTMLVLGLTFTGVLMLVKICEPFDFMRVMLLTGVLTAACIGVFLLPGAFGMKLSLLSLQDVLFIIVTVLGGYFLASILMRAMRALKILN
jgi:cation-transporting ATPase E